MHLSDYRLLKYIQYTKFIQKKLNINLYNYQMFAKKYIEYDINGKRKVYNDKDILLFEGEYINGQKNGKVKEYYDNGILSFEGEYINGQKNGKGKEYYDNGFLSFEGEYINGKKWNGKGFDINDNEYELKEGNGFIKEYYKKKIVSEWIQNISPNSTQNKKGTIKFEGDI